MRFLVILTVVFGLNLVLFFLLVLVSLVEKETEDYGFFHTFNKPTYNI